MGGLQMSASETSPIMKTANTVEQLVAATKDSNIRQIAVHSDLANASSISLSPGQSLRGEGDDVAITFAAGTDGLQLSSDNRIHNIRINASVGKRAIFNEYRRRKSRADRVARRDDDRLCSGSS